MPLSAGIFEYFLNLDFIVALTIQLRIMTTIKITHGLIAILLKFNFYQLFKRPASSIIIAILAEITAV